MPPHMIHFYISSFLLALLLLILELGLVIRFRLLLLLLGINEVTDCTMISVTYLIMPFLSSVLTINPSLPSIRTSLPLWDIDHRPCLRSRPSHENRCHVNFSSRYHGSFRSTFQWCTGSFWKLKSHPLVQLFLESFPSLPSRVTLFTLLINTAPLYGFTDLALLNRTCVIKLLLFCLGLLVLWIIERQVRYRYAVAYPPL